MLARVRDIQDFIRMVLAGVMADVQENAQENQSFVNHVTMNTEID